MFTSSSLAGTIAPVGPGFSAPLLKAKLPVVELLSFSAVGRPRSVALSWATSADYDNTAFVVERAADGQHFTDLGRVAAGTSVLRREYGLVDPQPLVGLNYYRLRQTGPNQEPTYSAIRVVRFSPNGPGAAVLAPNPATSHTLLNMTAVTTGDYTVEVLALTGEPVLPPLHVAAGLRYPLAISTLPAGAYVVRVANPATGQTQLLRLLKK